MKQIVLTQGKMTMVDEEDFKWLNQWKWYFDNGTGYATRNDRNTGKLKMVRMHRLINKTPKGFDTDHINRNKLDNRKINLRSATRRLSLINTGLQKNNTSGYKGISFNKRDKKWEVYIHKDNRRKVNLGCYSKIQDAILVRKQAELKYFKEFAYA